MKYISVGGAWSRLDQSHAVFAASTYHGAISVRLGACWSPPRGSKVTTIRKQHELTCMCVCFLQSWKLHTHTDPELENTTLLGISNFLFFLM